ncbi:hypothetical protein ACSQ67_025039 [Phaseolus vulgaris]
MSIRDNATRRWAGTSTHSAPARFPYSLLQPLLAQATPTLVSPQLTPKLASPHPAQDPLPSHNTQTPTSPTPIAAIPFGTGRDFPLPAPREKQTGGNRSIG